MLPFLPEEAPCSACSSVMSLQGPEQSSGACNLCAAASASEPLGICSACLTCGRRLCIGCCQKEAVRRLIAEAEKSIQATSEEAVRRFTAEAQESEQLEANIVQELQAAEAQASAASAAPVAAREAALRSKDLLESEARVERESLEQTIAGAKGDIEAKGIELRRTREQLEELRTELAAAAPRAAAATASLAQGGEDGLDDLRAARAEVASSRALAAEREEESAAHRAAAEEASAAEGRLHSEVAELRERVAQGRARRLCTLAAVRAELAIERRNAEALAESELAAAQAEELKARSGGAASSTSGARATSALAPAEPQEGLFGRFMGKLQGFVSDLEPLVMPLDSELGMAWGAPIDMQMGMPGGYGAMGTPAECYPWADDDDEEPQVDAADSEAAALLAEKAAWERRTAEVQRQLEWMRRDAERRSAEVAGLRAEVQRLRSERDTSSAIGAKLDNELAQEKQKMEDYHRSLLAMLQRAITQSRERVLVALRHGSVQTTSEIESIFGETCDWNAPHGGRQVRERQPAPASEAALAHNDERDTFAASLEALCEDLERAAVDAAEDARISGTLHDAMFALNAAADAQEATGAEWPGLDSQHATPTHTGLAGPPEVDSCQVPVALPAAAALAGADQEWPEAATAPSPVPAVEVADPAPPPEPAAQEPEVPLLGATFVGAQGDDDDEWPEAVVLPAASRSEERQAAGT